MCKCGKIVGLFDAESKKTGKHIRKLFCVGEEELTDNVKGRNVFEVWADGNILDADPLSLVGADMTYVKLHGEYAILDVEGLLV